MRGDQWVPSFMTSSTSVPSKCPLLSNLSPFHLPLSSSCHLTKIPGLEVTVKPCVPRPGTVLGPKISTGESDGMNE